MITTILGVIIIFCRMIEIKKWSYGVFRSFIYYLYTDRIEPITMPLGDMQGEFCDDAVPKCLEKITHGETSFRDLILFSRTSKDGRLLC